VKIFRHLILVLFFAGLVTLEVWHGVFRLGILTQRQQEEILETIRQGQSERARSFTENLKAERDHADFLRKLGRVRGLLAASESDEDRMRDELREDLLAYHGNWSGVIDRMSLYDATGRERFRSIRQGGGVAALSRDLLGSAEGRLTADIEALISTRSKEIVISDLEIESERVYVPESERQVIRYAALVAENDRVLGVLVLTLYAAPLLDRVRSWQPGPGIISSLIDGRGRFLAHPDRRQEVPGAPGLLGEHPAGGQAILSGERDARDGGVRLLATPVPEGLPGWRLVAVIPDSAIEASAVPIRGEYTWVIGSIAATSLFLVLAGAFFLRLSIREVRLAEESRYLERIRRESARYRALMEGAADMILIVAPERGVIREANAIARSLLALEEGECPLERVIPEAQLARFRERLHAAAAGAPVDLPELWLKGPGGREITASARLAAIDLGDEHVVEVGLRDLTLQKEMERQLRISERLGSLGLLTAGVAHEINNPLEGIENYLALLDREGADAARRTRYLELVRYGFRRIRDIVRDLSSFARPEVKGPRADITEVVDRALGMVRYDRAFRTVEVDRAGLDRPLEVLGDAGRLEQVFINLLVNAGRAMDSRGRVAISARAIEPGPGTPEPMVEVTVDDTGPGIPEENLGRIFDPFFTTGDGSGLGLAISYGIVKAHGGDIRAENRPGAGARFTIRLPAAAPAAEPGEPAVGDRLAMKRSGS
jgi:signal transduction histidine kinase